MGFPETIFRVTGNWNIAKRTNAHISEVEHVEIAKNAKNAMVFGSRVRHVLHGLWLASFLLRL